MSHGMHETDSMDSSAPSMSMVFTTTHNTPLYSSQWTPSTTGGYAATCIFLIVLALLDRVIGVWRRRLEAKWHDQAVKRRYIVLAGETAEDRERQMSLEGSEKNEEATLTLRGLDERVRVVRTPRSAGLGLTPWRLSVDLPRACVYTLWAGNSYLLMLAVMTLNVGYFLSILAGLFVGELALGRFITMEIDHH